MQPTTTNPPKSLFRKLIKIFIIFAVIVLVFVAIIFTTVTLATRQAVKVSDNFVADLQSNNATAAYALTSSEFQKENSEQTLASAFAQVSSLLQGKAHAYNKAIDKQSGKQNEAVVVYTIDTAAGKKYVRVVMTKDTSWKVENFRSSDTLLDTSSDN